MVLLMRIVLGLVALFFLAFGFRFVFTPDATAAEFFISPAGVAGLSTVRGDLGGAFLATATFIVLGLRPGGTTWLHAAALLLGLIAACRVVGLVVDGAVPSAIAALAVEIVFVALLLIGARRLAKV